MLWPFFYGVRWGIFLPVKTTSWLWACENRAGDARLFQKDPAGHDLKLLFWRQREKRDSRAEKEMPLERVGRQANSIY
jgi:hypothetical protein